MILNQILGDIRKKLKEGVVTGEQVGAIVNKINILKQQYINESKGAPPKKFNYDLPTHIEKKESPNEERISGKSSSSTETN